MLAAVAAALVVGGCRGDDAGVAPDPTVAPAPASSASSPTTTAVPVELVVPEVNPGVRTVEWTGSLRRDETLTIGLHSTGGPAEVRTAVRPVAVCVAPTTDECAQPDADGVVATAALGNAATHWSVTVRALEDVDVESLTLTYEALDDYFVVYAPAGWDAVAVVVTPERANVLAVAAVSTLSGLLEGADVRLGQGDVAVPPVDVESQFLDGAPYGPVRLGVPVAVSVSARPPAGEQLGVMIEWS